MKLTKLDSAVNSIAKYLFEGDIAGSGNGKYEITVPKHNYRANELDMTNEQYEELESLCQNFDEKRFIKVYNEVKKIQNFSYKKM